MAGKYGAYEVHVDCDDFENGSLFATERWRDGVSVEKTLSEIIIDAANYCANGKNKPFFSYFTRPDRSEPLRIS